MAVTVTVYPYSLTGKTTETMDYDDWADEVGNKPTFAVGDYSSGSVTAISDFSEWVAEMSITHEDIDADGAGREPKTGKMVRKYVTNKHTFNVTMVNHLPMAIAEAVYAAVHTTDARNSTGVCVYEQHPCSGGIATHPMYCSSVNFGAQRYDRQTGLAFYDGMKFNLIQL